MSGLFGAVTPLLDASLAGLCRQMTVTLRHFDWYHASTHVDEGLRVGVGQIGIQVVDRDAQPVCSADGQVTLLLCGELYRCDNLFRGAGAVANPLPDAAPQPGSPDGDLRQRLLSLYLAQGEEFIPRLEGVFQLAILDRTRRCLLIANDRFGLLPLYYAARTGLFAFAPEMKAVRQAPGVRCGIDQTAVAQYVRFQTLLGERTFFEDVRVLPPASLLRCDLDNAHVSLQPYWDFSAIPTPDPSLPYPEVVRISGELLRDAVLQRLDGDARPGVYLSAGLDSRAILGMCAYSDRKVTTLTYGLPGSRDAAYASQLARKAGVRHDFFPFAGGGWVREHADLHLTLTEGFHSWIHAHGISVLPAARQLMDVNLNGFEGEPYTFDDVGLLSEENKTAFTLRLYDQMTNHITWRSLGEGEERLLFDTPASRPLVGRAFDSLRELVSMRAGLPPRACALSFSFDVDRRLFLYFTVFNRSHVEQRFPFCDYGYLDFILGLPAEHLAGRELRKDILRRFCPWLVSTPYDKDEVPIARSARANHAARLLARARYAANRYLRPIFPAYASLYANYESWLRGELRAWGEDLLFSEQTQARGLFNPLAVRALWNGFQSSTSTNLIGKLAPLMTLELFLRKYT